LELNSTFPFFIHENVKISAFNLIRGVKREMGKDFVEIPLDKETYRKLEREAKKQGLTVNELATKLISETYDALKAKES